MLTNEALREMATRKLGAATLLLDHEYPDEAVYLGGYAIEFQLKARIVECQHLGGWPADAREGRVHGLGRLMTHDLHSLLTESDVEAEVKSDHMLAWSNCARWGPDSRYRPPGSVPPAEARAFVRDVEELLGLI